jgi:hypothetical protein
VWRETRYDSETDRARYGVQQRDGRGARGELTEADLRTEAIQDLHERWAEHDREEDDLRTV